MKQRSFGDNSSNYMSQRDINILGSDITLSLISDVVQNLLDDEVEIEFGSKCELPIYEGAKMKYNSIPIFKERFFIVANPKAIESLSKVFAYAERGDYEDRLVRKVVKEFNILNMSNQGRYNVDDKKYDNILLELHKKLVSTVSKSGICSKYYIESIEETIDLIIYHVFRQCKILDKPSQDYVNVYKEGANLNDTSI